MIGGPGTELAVLIDRLSRARRLVTGGGLPQAAQLALLPLERLVVHRPRPTADLLGDGFCVLGHRGAAKLAPENTMAGFAAAEALGVGIELDVVQCASGEVVVMHDDSLDRTTDGAGPVAEASWATISGLDAGAHFGRRWTGERVPQLAEVLATHGGDAPIDIELKSAKPPGPLAQAVVELIEDAGLVDKVFVSSFDPYMLEAARHHNPAIRRAQIFGTFEDSDLRWFERVALRNLLLNGKSWVDLVCLQHTIATRTYVRRLKRHGYRVLAWTVNDVADAQRMRSCGVDGIITDRPDRFV